MRSACLVCGNFVQSVRESHEKNVCNSPTTCSQNVRMGINLGFYARFIRRFSASFSTAQNTTSPLLFSYLSPASTGPINITTKYINNLGVVIPSGGTLRAKPCAPMLTYLYVRCASVLSLYPTLHHPTELLIKRFALKGAITV